MSLAKGRTESIVPYYNWGVRVKKVLGVVMRHKCGELVLRLLRMAGHDESWGMICFTTAGEAFELRNGKLRRCAI